MSSPERDHLVLPEGAVSASGLFTAPPDPGVYTVTAESSGVTGSTRIHVLQADTLYLTDEGHRQASLLLLPHPRAEGEPLCRRVLPNH